MQRTSIRDSFALCTCAHICVNLTCYMVSYMGCCCETEWVVKLCIPMLLNLGFKLGDAWGLAPCAKHDSGNMLVLCQPKICADGSHRESKARCGHVAHGSPDGFGPSAGSYSATSGHAERTVSVVHQHVFLVWPYLQNHVGLQR